MAKFTIYFNREEYGYVDIEAPTESDAIEIFDNGEYDNDEEIIKNGQSEVNHVAKN